MNDFASAKSRNAAEGKKKERCPIFHFDHGILMRNMHTINSQWNITIYSFKTVPTNCGVPRSLHPSHLHEQSVDAQAYSCFTESLWRHKLPAFVHTFSPSWDCLGLWFLLLGNIVPGQSFLFSHCRNLEDRTNLMFILKVGGRWISCLPTGQLNRWSCLGHAVWVLGQLSILQQRVDLALLIHRPHVCLQFTPLCGCRDHFN